MSTIAHISDLHFGRVNDAVVEAIVLDLEQQRPDLIAVSGDLTQRATSTQFIAARAFLDRLPPPFVVVPGNHDVPALWRFFERFFSTLGKYRRHICNDVDQVYMDDHIAVVALNTARAWTHHPTGFWKHGEISMRQLAWASVQLAEAPPKAVRIIVTHHPPAPPEPRHEDECAVNSHALVRTLEKSHVDLVLSGHLHLTHIADLRSHFPELKRQIWTVQASTATSTRLRGAPNAYNVIHIDGPTIKISVREWKDDHFEAAKTLSFTRDDMLPTPAEQSAARAPK